MEYEIKVIVPNAEAQMAFCNKLAMYRVLSCTVVGTAETHDKLIKMGF